MTARAAPDPGAALRQCLREAGREADTLVVAFSGGLDSTVLLHAAAREFSASRVVAAHVDLARLGGVCVAVRIRGCSAKTGLRCYSS